MVDFNNESTVGTPSANLVKILILQARANALDSLEKYNKQYSSGIQADQGILKSRLCSWLLEHSAYIERTEKNIEEYNKIKGYIFFNEKDLTPEQIQKIVEFLNNICDSIKLTRIDLKKAYDRTMVEEDNKNNDLS